MNVKRQIQLLRAICAVVVFSACLGVFTTGAWAFNTQTLRTPTETLEMGAFSVRVDGMDPDENGTYDLDAGEYSVQLQAYGNTASFVMTQWIPEGEEARLYIVWLDPTWEEDSNLEIPVSSCKPMTLTLTPVLEWPEEVDELPEQILVAAPAEPVEVTNEESENPQESTQPPEEEIENTENTGSEPSSTDETTPTESIEDGSTIAVPQEPPPEETEESSGESNTGANSGENTDDEPQILLEETEEPANPESAAVTENAQVSDDGQADTNPA